MGASEEGQTEAAEFLLQAGADVNARDAVGHLYDTTFAKCPPCLRQTFYI